MFRRRLSRGGALYSQDWIAVLLLLALVLIASKAGSPRSGEGSARMERAGPSPVELLPRRPAAYRDSLAGRRVVIDPGHGGSDPGAVGLASMPEKNIVLDTAVRLARELERSGSLVTLTRRGDSLPGGSGRDGLWARAQRVFSTRAEVLVSLHADSHPDPAVRGVTTYYYDPGDLPLARAVHEELVAQLGSGDRGTRQADFYLLRLSAPAVPAILVELGFLTHPQEARMLSAEAYRQKAAEAVADGLARYFASLGRR